MCVKSSFTVVNLHDLWSNYLRSILYGTALANSRAVISLTASPLLYLRLMY